MWRGAVIEVCACFNKFYYENRIMDDDPTVRAARLALTDAARLTIRNGLYLLGLEAPGADVMQPESSNAKLRIFPAYAGQGMPFPAFHAKMRPPLMGS